MSIILEIVAEKPGNNESSSLLRLSGKKIVVGRVGGSGIERSEISVRA